MSSNLNSTWVTNFNEIPNENWSAFHGRMLRLQSNIVVQNLSLIRTHGCGLHHHTIRETSRSIQNYLCSFLFPLTDFIGNGPTCLIGWWPNDCNRYLKMTRKINQLRVSNPMDLMIKLVALWVVDMAFKFLCLGAKHTGGLQMKTHSNKWKLKQPKKCKG